MSIESKRIVLEELRRLFDDNYSATDVLDSKLQNVLNFSGAIVTLAATIILALAKSELGIVFWVLLIVAIILYIAMFILGTRGLKPGIHYFPISKCMKVLDDKYFHVSEEQALGQDIVDHLHVIEIAVSINTLKASALDTATKLMFGIILLLIFSVVLGLTFPSPTLPCFFHLASCVGGKS